MPHIPDNSPNKYERIVVNYKQIRRKLKKLDDVYIDATNNKQVLKEIRDILVDVRQTLKIMNGIHKDDDVDG